MKTFFDALFVVNFSAGIITAGIAIFHAAKHRFNNPPAKKPSIFRRYNNLSQKIAYAIFGSTLLEDLIFIFLGLIVIVIVGLILYSTYTYFIIPHSVIVKCILALIVCGAAAMFVYVLKKSEPLKANKLLLLYSINFALYLVSVISVTIGMKMADNFDALLFNSIIIACIFVSSFKPLMDSLNNYRVERIFWFDIARYKFYPFLGALLLLFTFSR